MRFAFSLLLTAAFLLSTKPSFEKQSYRFNYRMRTIVIDPGHGGHDGGCHGVVAHEKNVTLAIALKLGAMIEKNIPGTKVIYTRKTDVFVDLNERANIANRANADLFISIHCNANKNTAAFGTESWTMGLHKTEGNLEVAKRENSVILMEDDYKSKYDGFDPNSPEAYIVFSLNQSAFIDQSLELAAKVEDEFKKDERSSRGVKQAGFLVLWKTVMPATLIETGFLTNRNEEKYLNSETGQHETAKSIFDAVYRYKNKMEKEVNSLFNTEDHTLTGKTDTIRTIEKTEIKPKPVSVKADSLHQPVSTNPTPIEVNATTYRIQIAASNKLIDNKLSPYNKLTKSFCEKDETNTFRLFAGPYQNIEEAKTAHQEVKQKGFKDSFIVHYQNGKRIKSIY